MQSKISVSLELKSQPVAVLLTNDDPAEGLKFKEATWGCVASMLVAASKGRTAYFDRNTFGCVGGGTGLGFGNQYEENDFPIEYLLSTGKKDYNNEKIKSRYITEGECYIKTPELALKFVENMPMRNIKEKFVTFKPLELLNLTDKPEMVIFLVNPDQLSALVVLSNYDREDNMNVIAPFCAGCQSILFGYAEEEKENPKATIGFFDISARKYIDKNLLTFTIPFKMFRKMESNVEKSFLTKEQWLGLNKRNE
ncbi:MAG: DUF169 domain-containing protein [Ignavibacteria bacterium]|jgi:uncharacterized protein (DUF169 family)